MRKHVGYLLFIILINATIACSPLNRDNSLLLNHLLRTMQGGGNDGNTTSDFTVNLTPAHGSLNVPFNTDLTIVFSETPVTFNNWDITVTSSVATGHYNKDYLKKCWKDSDTELTFTPDIMMPAGSNVTVVISGFVAAHGGDTITGRTTYTFAIMNSFVASLAPELVDCDVKPDTNVLINFSKGALTTGSWKVTINTTEYSTASPEVSWNASGTVLTINPSLAMAAGRHTVILEGFVDTLGAPLAGSNSFTFLVNDVTTDSGIEMQLVEGGFFTMGDSKDEFPNNNYGMKPPHSVSVAGIYLGKYEITYEQWSAIHAWAVAHDYTDLGAGKKGGSVDYQDLCIEANQPVTSIKWYDAVKWCNALSEKEGLEPCYYTDNELTTVYRTGSIDILNDCVDWSANGYRLPTEAEWEYSAKGGALSHDYSYSGTNRHNVGSDYSWFGDYGWCWYIVSSFDHTDDSYDSPEYMRSLPVGRLLPNELGLYDMMGNVMEWCWDWYDVNYYQDCYENGWTTDLHGPTGPSSNRTTRGGHYHNHDMLYLMNAKRDNTVPNLTGDYLLFTGLRICKKI